MRKSLTVMSIWASVKPGAIPNSFVMRGRAKMATIIAIAAVKRKAMLRMFENNAQAFS